MRPAIGLNVVVMDSKPTPVVVFVGGVGSGKSAVARWLADHYAVALIDADQVGHQVLLREDMKVKFWLDPIRLQSSHGFRRAEANRIQRLVQENREYLLRCWHEYFGN